MISQEIHFYKFLAPLTSKELLKIQCHIYIYLIRLPLIYVILEYIGIFALLLVPHCNLVFILFSHVIRKRRYNWYYTLQLISNKYLTTTNLCLQWMVTVEWNGPFKFVFFLKTKLMNCKKQFLSMATTVGATFL